MGLKQKILNLGWVLSLLGSTVALAEETLLEEVRVNSEIAALVARCNSSIENSDWVACPEIKKYQFDPNLSMSQIVGAIEEELSYSLSQTSAEKALQALDSRLSSYVDMSRSEFETENADLFEKTTKRLLGILAAQAKSPKNKTFVDRDTYWAPSVNASAALVINPEKGTLYVYIIGDTDG